MGGDQDRDQPESDGDQPDGDDAHQYVDRSTIDFDPDDGLYTGTAVEGTSEIPGPHEQGDDTETDTETDSRSDGSDESGSHADDE